MEPELERFDYSTYGYTEYRLDIDERFTISMYYIHHAPDSEHRYVNFMIDTEYGYIELRNINV